MTKLWFSVFVGLAFALAGAADVSAHRYHTSITRIDHDSKAKLLQVTIQLFAHDVTEVLSKKAGKLVDLGKAEELDPLLRDYLFDHFILQDRSGAALKLKWVGKEAEVDTIYVYLEVPVESAPKGFMLRNSIFFESFATQTNLVVARYSKAKSDLVFRPGDKSKRL